MIAFIKRIIRSLWAANSVPQQHRQVFNYLYLDIAWFGVLSGTTISFITVFATRQGATTEQIGLLSALPALINLLFSLPAGIWLANQPLGHAVFWTSVLNRMFYLLLIPLPVLLMPEAQVWVIITTTLLMTIPGVAVAVGFNALFGEIVPVEWRGHVMGIRNAIGAFVTTAFTLFSGWMLDTILFPYGYIIIFSLGAVGAGMSSVYLYRISKAAGLHERAVSIAAPADLAASTTRRLAGELKLFARRSLQNLNLDIMKGPYKRIMMLLFGWHLFQFMTIPIITPFVVNDLHVSNQIIGLAGSLFNVTLFFASLRLSRMAARFGNQRLTGAGIVLLAFFPILTSFGTNGYLLGNAVGGIGWGLVGGAMFNYLLDNVPPGNRPSYLAWYSLVSNAAILIGSLSGPLIAGQIGFVTALFLFGFGRIVAGLAILRWG